ncbi:Lipase (class 2) [Actinokineospora alba]|uniref:Lipase (Class 2) n=1 Tax=Actinokineospora alba TaxID=504798 RepID=A0A1H0WE93_9PSEU|nr:alpha/beta fold hydrolase [Actinokineospora alba]TDP68925.1 lipase (class 2) [Actinokineospora alba]SDI75336.1 Lipase (class 2) [Actinokineospora alba]SDP89109.1 Lipase (class 2) [Actinokineospora alba]
MRSRSTRVSLIAAAVALVAGAGIATIGPASAADAPTNFQSAYEYSVANPNATPPGANNFGCPLSFLHPRPVVLVHGTFENMYDNWGTMSPTLQAAGFCVFALNYGSVDPTRTINGTGDIPTSAKELSAFIDQVLAKTGASKVDIVGHSQGGMMPRYYIKNLGGASKVNKLIGLAPSNHGTTVAGLSNLLTSIPLAKSFIDTQCPACSQQFAGSEFLTQLNAGGETDPAVKYTVIQTRYDEVVTPYTSAWLAPASNVKNKLVQDMCPLDPVEHIGIAWDPLVIQQTMHELDSRLPAVVACL